MQSTASYSQLLANIRSIIQEHQSEDIRIKFLGVLHGPTGEYLYSIGCTSDEDTCASDQEMRQLIHLLPAVTANYNSEEIMLEVMSCSPDLEELASDCIPKGYMEEVYSLLQQD